MHVQTHSQTQQNTQTLPSTSENIVEEADNKHVTGEIERLIEKALAFQQIEMFA